MKVVNQLLVTAILAFVKYQGCNAHTSAFCTVTSPDYPSSVSFFQGTYHAYSGNKAPGKLHIIPPSGIKHSFEYIRSFNAIGGCDPDDSSCGINNCNRLSCGTLIHGGNTNATHFKNSIMTQAYCGSIGCGKYDFSTRKCTGTEISQSSSNLQCANIDPHSIHVQCYTYTSGSTGSQIVRATLPQETGFCPNAQMTNGKEIRTWYTAEVRDVVSGIYKIYSTDTDYLLDPESNPMAAPCSLSSTNFLHIPLTVADAALRCASEPPSYPFVTKISENCHANAISGTQCAYECQNGYNPVGDLICQNGRWSDVFCTDKHVCSVTNLAQEIDEDVAGVSGKGCGFNTISNTFCEFNCIQEDGIVRWSRGEIICNSSTGEWSKYSTYQPCQTLNKANASASVPYLENYNLLNSLSTIKVFWRPGNQSDVFVPPTLRYEFNTSCLIGHKCNGSLYCPSYVGAIPPDMGHTCVGVRANDHYTVRIRACNIASCSEWSHQLSITIPATTTTTSSTQITTNNPPKNTTQETLFDNTTTTEALANSTTTYGHFTANSTTWSGTHSNLNETIITDFPANTTIAETSSDLDMNITTHDTSNSEIVVNTSISSSTLSNLNTTTTTINLPVNATMTGTSVDSSSTNMTSDVDTSTSSSTLSNLNTTTTTINLPVNATMTETSVDSSFASMTSDATSTTPESIESSHKLSTTRTILTSSSTLKIETAGKLSSEMHHQMASTPSSMEVRTTERIQNNVESNSGQQAVLSDGIIAGIIVACIILTILIVAVSIVLRKKKIKKDATVGIDQGGPSVSRESCFDVEKGQIKKVVPAASPHNSHSKEDDIKQAINLKDSITRVKIQKNVHDRNHPTIMPSETALL